MLTGVYNKDSSDPVKFCCVTCEHLKETRVLEASEKHVIDTVVFLQGNIYISMANFLYIRRV